MIYKIYLTPGDCYNLATSWENLFKLYANNKGADQPVHPHSLMSAFVVRCLDSIVSLVSIFAIPLLSLTSVAEQTGLSLEILKDRFSRDVVHIRQVKAWEFLPMPVFITEIPPSHGFAYLFCDYALYTVGC